MYVCMLVVYDAFMSHVLLLGALTIPTHEGKLFNCWLIF